MIVHGCHDRCSHLSNTPCGSSVNQTGACIAASCCPTLRRLALPLHLAAGSFKASAAMSPKKASVPSKASKAPPGVLRSGRFSDTPDPLEKRSARRRTGSRSTAPRRRSSSSSASSSSAEGPWRPVTGPKSRAPRGPPPPKPVHSHPPTASNKNACLVPPPGGPVPKHLPAGPPPPTPAPGSAALFPPQATEWCCSCKECGGPFLNLHTTWRLQWCLPPLRDLDCISSSARVDGRLLHVRIDLGNRATDAVNVYQKVYQTGGTRLEKGQTSTPVEQRTQVWNTLRALLNELTTRHHLVLTGDFNALPRWLGDL